MTTTTRLLTFEEFVALPDTPGKRELLEGELIELPVPEARHSKITPFVFKGLDGALEQAHARGEAADLGVVYPETGYKLSNDTYVRPDVSVNHARQAESKFFEGAPAIAIEIISPGNTVEEMDIKTRLYFEHGANEVWRIHPKGRYVAVHVHGSVRLLGEDETLTTPLLPGLALSVREILGA